MKDPKLAAPESEHVRRARRKLQKVLQDEAKLFSPERLKQVSEVMRTWIARYTGERESLKERTIGLFDGNQHTEQPHSQYVKQLRDRLSTVGAPAFGAPMEEEAEEHAMAALKGRFSSPLAKTIPPGSSSPSSHTAPQVPLD